MSLFRPSQTFSHFNNKDNILNQRVIFKDGTRRTNGLHALKYNLLAAKLIAELVKDMLGPLGLEKLFIDILGEETLTKDGATFLRKIDVEHPAAKILIEASNAVDNAVGDGTTSVVVFAGALIEKAEKLLELGISPTTICEGYQEAMKIALDTLSHISLVYQNSDRSIMQRIASTCLGSKAICRSSLDKTTKKGEENVDHIARLVVDAVYQITDFDSKRIDTDDIKIEQKPGNPDDTELITGIVIDKTIDSSAMPRSVKKAKILLIEDDGLEPRSTKTDAQITIALPQQYKSFSERQSTEIMHKVKRIIDSGANVVISRAGISLLAQTHFAKAGIISIRRVKENDLLWLQKATGAKIIRDLDDETISTADHAAENVFGYAQQVHEKFVGDDKIVFVEGCKSPKALTLLVRAGSRRMLDEYHRSVLDAINVLKDYIETPSIVAGGGSTEVIIAREVRRISTSFAGRNQLVLEKFADALEEIPLTIARNAGMNTIDALVQLRSKNNIFDSPGTIANSEAYGQGRKSTKSKEHYRDNGSKRKDIISSGSAIVNGSKWFGVNVFNRCVDEMLTLGVIEPTLVKQQIITTATEVTNLLLRVDDVLMSKPIIDTHTHNHTHSHADGTSHSHEGGNKAHDHYFDLLGKHQRPAHHYY